MRKSWLPVTTLQTLVNVVDEAVKLLDECSEEARTVLYKSAEYRQAKEKIEELTQTMYTQGKRKVLMAIDSRKLEILRNATANLEGLRSTYKLVDECSELEQAKELILVLKEAHLTFPLTLAYLALPMPYCTLPFPTTGTLRTCLRIWSTAVDSH